MNNIEKWIWLSEALYKGSRKANALLSHFGTVSEIYSADRASLLRCGIPFGEKELARLTSKSLDDAKKILSDCEAKKIRLILRTSPEFPERLLETHDCPVLLYAKGLEMALDSEPVISIVGTRKASASGCDAARKISSEIAAQGGVVCSGMARGVDTIAMEAALKAGGKVIGVLGCGVDVCYPSENRDLMMRVEEHGIILSEFPPKTAPDRTNFPKRNRIISALSLGVCVIEAPEKSGALITAQCALDQNKDVFAVPSGIFEPLGKGSNNLIRMGAAAVTSGADILGEYTHLFPDKINLSNTALPVEETPVKEEVATKPCLTDAFLASHSPDEQIVLRALENGEKRADEISAQCDLPIAKVLSLLTMLEIRKSVKQLPGCRFKIANS